MSDFRISIPGGEARRLKTGGKYCPSDIIIETTGGSGGDGGSLPDAETKAFGMQTVDTGWSWFKTGYQGEYGYTAVPSITEEMTNGHPYLIWVSIYTGDTYIEEIIATATPLLANPNNNMLGTPNPIDWYLYDANFNSNTWEYAGVMEDYSDGVPTSILNWSNYDIQIAEEFGGGESGWIGYEPIKMEGIENGAYTSVAPEYRISGEMLNHLAAAIQLKTGFHNMLTPAEMRNSVARTGMFCFESSASGRTLS